MIVQGDNGTRIKCKIFEESSPVDLMGAVVVIKLKGETDVGVRTKTAWVNPQTIGECEVELLSEDIAMAGMYQAQISVTYPNGNVYSSNIQRFLVGSQLS